MMNRKPKKSDSTSKLVLEEIIGLTSKNGNGLASNVLMGDCIYIAGCVVVVYNVNSGTQTHLMVSSRNPKPLNCVAALHGPGKFVAAGESGHQPAVLVWDYSTQTVVSELKIHRFGVSCIAFSSDGKHLVSVGFPHDGYLCLWDWRSGIMVTKIKSSSSCTGISCVSFSSDARVFVTAGKKHLKFWTLDLSTRSRSNVGESLPALDGKSANLGCQKGSSFVSVASASWSASTLVGTQRVAKLFPIYALTDTGVLCHMKSSFSVTRWVDLEVEKCFAMSVSDKFIACACANGLVKLFTIETIKYTQSLLYQNAKECHKGIGTAGESKTSENASQPSPALPDAIACQFSTSEKLVVVYGNHSLYIWDVRGVFQVSRCCVLVSHSSCIWDVKNLPCENMHDPALACVARGCRGGISFATCSTDGTIRLWDLLLQQEMLIKADEPGDVKQQSGGTSVDPVQVSALHLASAGIFERDIVEPGVDTQGFRSMAVSSDGKYLAAGDCKGSLHLYNLQTSDYTCIQNAHESEILSLSFSLPIKDYVSKEHEVSEDYYLLASGGRDRMIHLYAVKRGIELIESIDDHSAAVTSVKLAFDGCKILSCSADRSLVFRDVAITENGCKVSRSHHQIASHGTVYDMAIDPSMEVVVTVGQDKKINAFSISGGKLIKTFKQDGSFGEPIKVTLDPSSNYLVCSYSNKSMCVYDFNNGELVLQAVGHGEVITSIIILPDCKHIVSVSGDGCIFVWRLPASLSSRMLQQMMVHDGPLSPRSTCKLLIPNEGISYDEVGYQEKDGNYNRNSHFLPLERGSPNVSAFKFSISRLPKWAQAKVTCEDQERVSPQPESVLFQNVEPESTPSLMNNNDTIPAFKVPIEVDNPCQNDIDRDELCLTDVSKSSVAADSSGYSSLPRKDSGFSLDKRWLTVHTIYHDLLYSPEGRDFKDAKVSTSKLLEDSAITRLRNEEDIEMRRRVPAAINHLPESFCCPSNEIVEEEDHLSVQSSRTSCEDSTENTRLSVQDNGDNERMSRDDDLFIQNFSNLSSAQKPEGGRLSERRSYSSRFSVRRDPSNFEASNQTLPRDSLNSRDEAITHISLRHPSNPSNQDFEGRTPSSRTRCSRTDHSIKGLGEEDNQIQETVDEFTEALLNLEIAADKTIKGFSKVRSLIGKEDEPKVYDQVSKFLPSVIGKIQTLAELVQSSTRDSCRNDRTKDLLL